MPLQCKTRSLAAAARFPLVPNGNRLTEITILPQVNGAAFNVSLDLGNNQIIGPLVQHGRVIIGADVPEEDVSEGLALIVNVPTAGESLTVMTSYNRGGKRGGIGFESGV
jgi:hypothetical protein